MDKKKKEILTKEMKESINKSIDELDTAIRTGGQRFLDVLVSTAVSKVVSAWEVKKEMLQDAIKEGREDGKNKRKVKEKSGNAKPHRERSNKNNTES